MNVEEYWKTFLKDNNLPEDMEYDEAFSFGGFTPEGSDELLQLVLDGKKRATTSVYLENESYPAIGSYSIVLDSKGNPRCIIRTTNYRIMRFKDMTFEIASKEGEDEVLDTWIFNHSVLFSEEGKECGYVFTPDMPIFFEEFEVVYI